MRMQIEILIILLLWFSSSNAQEDNLARQLQQLPVNYVTTVEGKIEKYQQRLKSAAEKSLTKLARWETKIQSILEKANPEGAQKLFGPGKLTFNTALQKLIQGQQIAEGYKAKYDAYRDKLNISLIYLEQQKEQIDNRLAKPLQQAKQKADELEEDILNSEALTDFVKERKKQLIDESLKYIGKSKYLTKINKEAYYYVETIRNYKTLFSDTKKAEEAAISLLNKIPAFQKFSQDNNMLSSLFSMPGSSSSNANLAGLQTRVQIGDLLQQRINAGGVDPAKYLRQQMQSAQSQLNDLKNVQGPNQSSEDLKPVKVKPLLPKRPYVPEKYRPKWGKPLNPIPTINGVSVMNIIL